MSLRNRSHGRPVRSASDERLAQQCEGGGDARELVTADSEPEEDRRAIDVGRPGPLRELAGVARAAPERRRCGRPGCAPRTPRGDAGARARARPGRDGGLAGTPELGHAPRRSAVPGEAPPPRASAASAQPALGVAHAALEIARVDIEPRCEPLERLGRRAGLARARSGSGTPCVKRPPGELALRQADGHPQPADALAELERACPLGDFTHWACPFRTCPRESLCSSAISAVK